MACWKLPTASPIRTVTWRTSRPGSQAECECDAAPPTAARASPRSAAELRKAAVGPGPDREHERAATPVLRCGPILLENLHAFARCALYCTLQLRERLRRQRG